MRTNFDFAPFYRSSIGFDRVFDLLDNATRVSSIDNFPPYDIAKTGDDAYRIQIAVAGYGRDELSISTEPNLLIVTGEKTADSQGAFLHRGIANRNFTRRFELADHVKVTAANLVNGLLTVELQREIPEAMKPRRILIGTAATGSAQQIEQKRAA
jgi:molecular chaperone IbpA